MVSIAMLFFSAHVFNRPIIVSGVNVSVNLFICTCGPHGLNSKPAGIGSLAISSANQSAC